MTKEQFEKLELEATKKTEEDSCAQMHQDIHNEFVSIWNEIFDFCYENDLEPDAVLSIIRSKITKELNRQIKTQGYISKVYQVAGKTKSETEMEEAHYIELGKIASAICSDMKEVWRRNG